MNFKKPFLRSLLFLVLAAFLFACQSGDSRVLGTIESKKYTVDGLLSLFLSPDAMKEARKNFTDKDLVSGFQHLAAFVVFSGEADRLHFFDQNPAAKQKLDMQTKQIYNSAYQRYINDKILTPMLDKITATDADLAPYQKRVQVRHILLSKDGSMKNPEKGKALEATILKELKKGTSFADLAKKYSEDPGSKDSGGLIPDWIYTNSAFVPSFKTAALGATKVHQIIPDVQSEYGTHIIYIENLQNRSASEIKKNDPQVYNQVLEEKKDKTRNEFTEELLKEFPIEVNKSLDFKKYFSSYTPAKGGEVLYTINKNIEYTGKDFVDEVLGDAGRLKGAFKQNPDLDMEKAVKALGVMPIIERLYAQKKGLDKEEGFKKSLYIPLLALKANLYLEDLIKKEGPKPTPIPKFAVSDKEVQQFYNLNKVIYTKPAQKKGENPVVLPLNASLKQDIRNKIILRKNQQFRQNESQKLMDFIQQQAEKLYPNYKVSLNKGFIKPEEKKEARSQIIKS